MPPHSGRFREEPQASGRRPVALSTGLCVRQPIDLRALVDDVLSSLQPRCVEAKAEVEVAVPALTLHSDHAGLALVLRNLLDNAIAFSRDRDPPRIRIAVVVSPSLLQLSVEDNGIGFDMQYHDRIFEIFQRLHRSEDYPGTGVGLALVRRATNRLGGRVWAQSTVGAGSHFFVELPR